MVVFDVLEVDKSLCCELLVDCLGLLEVIVFWYDSGQQGLCCNFVLYVCDFIKVLSNSEWCWLDLMFDFEWFGIVNFV